MGGAFPKTSTRPGTPILALYSITIFSGAFLLFLVQPIIGKYILPWFGGSAAVWTTCIVFFQTVLLLGYAYGHLLTRYLQPRWQAILHVLLLLSALLVLPIIPGDHWKPTADSNPTLRILTLLLFSLGLPYFTLASTGPLLQRWLTLLFPDRSPYRLYALSNAGSLLALLAYPFLVESLLTRKAQAEFWTWGMMIFVALCSAVALSLWRRGETGSVPDARQSVGDRGASPTLIRRISWIVLPGVASVLLLSTTNKLCQEVVPMPLLWVLPLSTYLMTFILTFDHPRWYSRKLHAAGYLAVLSVVCCMMFHEESLTFLTQLVAYSGLLFFGSMICHGEVARLKPPSIHLTSFYLSIATGDAVGGIAVTFLAPILFSGYYEFQCAALLSCGLALFLLFPDMMGRKVAGKSQLAWTIAFGGVLLFGVLFYRQAKILQHNTIDTARNFFSTLIVSKYNEDDPDRQFLIMRHGRTLHGYQFTNPRYHHIATSYFSEKGGVGRVLASLPDSLTHRVGIVGLGVGTLAVYGRPGDYFRLYEINPQVQELAEKRFTYLADCKARKEIILGDARLSMEHEQPQEFDLLVLDAFNSEAPPVHLLTVEAFTIFLRHLKPDGIIAVNITSKQVNLHAVVAAAANALHMQQLVLTDLNAEGDLRRFPSEWIVLSRNPHVLQQPKIQEAAMPERQSVASIPAWTDDYTSLFQVMNW